MAITALAVSVGATAFAGENCEPEKAGGRCNTLYAPKGYDYLNNGMPVEAGTVKIKYVIYPATKCGKKRPPVLLSQSTRPIMFNQIDGNSNLDPKELAHLRETQAVVVFDVRTPDQFSQPTGTNDPRNDLEHVITEDISLLVKELKNKLKVDNSEITMYARGERSVEIAQEYSSTIQGEKLPIFADSTKVGDNDSSDSTGGDIELDEEMLENIADKVPDGFSEETSRKFFGWNEWLRIEAFDPLNRIYEDYIPEIMRTGIKNFYVNLKVKPTTLPNQILQGHPVEAGKTLVRFVLDSTLGVAGLINVSERLFGMGEQIEEDMGQTFRVWGWDIGHYWMIPLMGPKTGVDIKGDIGDAIVRAARPGVPYIEILPKFGVLPFALPNMPSELTNLVHKHKRKEIAEQKKQAVDWYLTVKRLYLENREEVTKKWQTETNFTIPGLNKLLSNEETTCVQ